MSARLAGRRILVIGINYWPEPTGIAPYTTGMAEHLVELGASVEVLTGVPHYPQWRVAHPSTVRATQEWHGGVKLVRLRHFVPRRMTALHRALYEGTFLVRAAARGARARPDLVLAITPALGAALAGVRIARRAACPMVVVVQDLTARATEQSGIAGGSRLTRLTARMEGFALRAATRVAIVSESFRNEVEAYDVAPTRVVVARNWTHIAPSTSSRSEARSSLGWPHGKFIVVHTGNMGLKQDLGNVLAAARELEGRDILIVLTGDGSQRQSLEREAAGMTNVRFAGVVDNSTYAEVLAAADVLLINERSSVREMSLPSKITSYIAAGRPIVAAVVKGGASDRELFGVRDAVITVAAGDPTALATALRGLLMNESRLAGMAAAAGVARRERVVYRDAALGVLDELLVSLLPASPPEQP